MSTRILNSGNVKPIGYTRQGLPMWQSSPSLLSEYIHSAVKDSQAAPICGNTSECKVEWTDPTTFGVIKDLRWEAQCTSDGTNGLTFYNPFLFFDSIVLYINGTEVDNLHNQDEIRTRVNLWERSLNPNEFYSEKQRYLNQTGSSVGGLVIAATGTTYIRLPLINLFPYLQDRYNNSFGQGGSIRIVWRYANNGGSTATVGQFCVASSTTNTLPLIALSGIQVKSVIQKVTNPYLIMNPNQALDIVHKADCVYKNGAFNTADVDYFKFNLKTDFPQRNCCRYLFLYAESNSNRTAYNDTDNGVMVSIPESICIEVRFNTIVVFTHRMSAQDLIARRRYNYDVQLANFGPILPEAMTSGNNINKYLVMLCCIDFANIETLGGLHEGVLSGISSNTNVDVYVYCGTTGVHASDTNMHACLVWESQIVYSPGAAGRVVVSTNDVPYAAPVIMGS